MPTLVIVGALWGDEAKGKIVDALAHEAKYVVRTSGGANAGHTVICNGQTHKFHLLPVGILQPGVTSILGSGMVIDPKALLHELEVTQSSAGELGKLLISATAHVVFPYHSLIDQLEEAARGSKIGTTSRGIGPAYTDKVQRIGIRMGEFVQPDVLAERLREVVGFKNSLLHLYGEPEIDLKALLDEYQGYADQLRPYVADTETVLLDAVEASDRVLFEGAQGTFLDLDHGTYPYVTSSHPTAAGACLGSGVGPRAIDQAFGVCKMYATRVGAGPFPTELCDATGDLIREIGREYGTTTGRPRRCGWMDLVLLRHSCRVNSLSGLVVTCADVLAGLPEVKMAVEYRVDGQPLRRMPTSLQEWAKVEPVFESLPGWKGDIRSARSWTDLPSELQFALRRMEEVTGTPVAILSVGPDRDETIILRPELIWS